MTEYTEEEFELVKAKGEGIYKSLEDVHCPYFKENVAFSGEGLAHLKFKTVDRARS